MTKVDVNEQRHLFHTIDSTSNGSQLASPDKQHTQPFSLFAAGAKDFKTGFPLRMPSDNRAKTTSTNLRNRQVIRVAEF